MAECRARDERDGLDEIGTDELLADSRGYSSKSMTIISEPDPTEVIPTMKPPAKPIKTVAVRFVCNGGASAETPKSMPRA